MSVEEKAYEIRQVGIKKVSDKLTNGSVEIKERRCQKWGLLTISR